MEDWLLPLTVDFKMYSETDLYEFAKNKLVPYSLCFSPDGTKFATMSKDQQVPMVALRHI